MNTPHFQKTLSDFQSRLQRALGDDFLIERELGGAGMSRVFVAVETALQRRVVVKVLPPELAAGVNVERFRREIQLAAGLQHPHIVPLLSAGDDDGLLWFTMPFIEGESLRGALLNNKRLPPRDVVRILHDVVDALAYAHARGIVHRDIKPENILTSGMHALVTDFGVAKAISAAIPAHGGTTTGMAIGTPAYMAPEQLAADPAADHRVDLYAVGLLAYELLTGQAPFTGSSPQATLAAQLTKMPEPPHRSLSDVPESLSAVVMSCLAKDASRRPASAEALMAELDALPPMGSGRTSIFQRRRPSTRKLLAGAAVLAVAMTLVFAQRTSKSAALGAGGSALTTAADSMRARDAGPGGSRTPGMEVAPGGDAQGSGGTGSGRLRAAPPETVVVVLREGVNSDGLASMSVPVVISRADSFAIAAAIRARTETGPAAPGPQAGQRSGQRSAIRNDPLGVGAAVAGANSAAATATVIASGALSSLSPPDSANSGRRGGPMGFVVARQELLEEVRRVFSDSMSHAMVRMDSALAHLPREMRNGVPKPPPSIVAPLISPNTDGRVRVVVGSFTGTGSVPQVRDASRGAASFFREGLPNDGFEIIDDETTRRAVNTSPDRMAVGWMLRADYMVTGVVREHGDSLSLLTIFTDVRGGRFSRVVESMAPMSNPRPMFEVALKNVTQLLDSARMREGRGRDAKSRGFRGEAPGRGQ